MLLLCYCLILLMLLLKFQLNWHRGDCKSIEEHMSRDILPVCLGGSLEVEDVRNWYQIVLDKEDIFAGNNYSISCFKIKSA